MTHAPRVVLDTNVVLSALLFARGDSARLRQAWLQGVCIPLVSTVTAQELIRVLTYPKFRLSADQQEQLLADYLPYARSVRIPEPPPSVPDCRGPLDTPFLHLAIAGRAGLWVTGNKDLHALSGRLPFPIKTLGDFITSLPA